MRMFDLSQGRSTNEMCSLCIKLVDYTSSVAIQVINFMSRASGALYKDIQKWGRKYYAAERVEYRVRPR
jgi:hypothetical protein